MSRGGILPCFGRHSLRPENSAESPRQVQSRHDLVCDQRLSAARPESQGPVFDEIGGTHQSGLGTEGVRLLWSLHHHFGVCITTAVIKREFVGNRQADQACTEPRETHARGSMSLGGAMARGTEHPYVCVFCTSVSTPLN